MSSSVIYSQLRSKNRLLDKFCAYFGRHSTIASPMNKEERFLKDLPELLNLHRQVLASKDLQTPFERNRIIFEEDILEKRNLLVGDRTGCSNSKRPPEAVGDEVRPILSYGHEICIP
ncbi:hypothetical protein HG530_008410 [Fusarium avenaceum]|nr:hypothetical protein HG530_008410 [Fusarium avenaceum]